MLTQIEASLKLTAKPFDRASRNECNSHLFEKLINIIASHKKKHYMALMGRRNQLIFCMFISPIIFTRGVTVEVLGEVLIDVSTCDLVTATQTRIWLTNGLGLIVQVTHFHL